MLYKHIFKKNSLSHTQVWIPPLEKTTNVLVAIEWLQRVKNTAYITVRPTIVFKNSTMLGFMHMVESPG
jgi:hypothetical protein